MRTDVRVVLTRRAQKDVSKLESGAAKRILRTLKGIDELPVPGARALRDSQIGSYRLRVGDFRIIFDIDGSTVVVLRIGHRREIYR